MGDMDISGEKREQIIRAAMKNFSKNGYRKTVMDEIVADAGVSKGDVYKRQKPEPITHTFFEVSK